MNQANCMMAFLCCRSLINTKVSRNSRWRHKWVVYCIVTRPRGSVQTRPWAQPRLHSPPQDSFSQTPLLLVSMATVRYVEWHLNSQWQACSYGNRKKTPSRTKISSWCFYGDRSPEWLIFFVFLPPRGIWHAVLCTPKTLSLANAYTM